LKDTRIVEMLEDETSMLSLVFAVAYRGGSNYKDAFGTVGIWDTTLYRKIRLEGMVPPIKNVGNTDLGVLEGGFVKDPQVGLHEWVVSFDLDSLYPHLMMGSNLSPETLVDEKYLEKIAKQDE
jgi:DNA polymerase elongation subunit (family B)